MFVYFLGYLHICVFFVRCLILWMSLIFVCDIGEVVGFGFGFEDGVYIGVCFGIGVGSSIYLIFGVEGVGIDLSIGLVRLPMSLYLLVGVGILDEGLIGV